MNKWQGKEFIFILNHPKRYIKGKVLSVALNYSFTLFTKEDGLIHNSIWSILEDKSGNLWIGTRETGLSRFDGKTFQTYSEYKQAPPTD